MYSYIQFTCNCHVIAIYAPSVYFRSQAFFLLQEPPGSQKYDFASLGTTINDAIYTEKNNEQPDAEVV